MELHKPPSVGKNILHLRKEKNLSMDELSKQSSVSKSMLSQIEQEKTNPTVMTVWKISRALGVTIEKIIGGDNNLQIEVIRHNDAPIIYSKDKSFLFRINSPIYMTDSLELYYITAKPHGINESKPHFKGAEEYITVLSGKFRITAGNYSSILSIGDTAKYKADQEHSIENITDGNANAFLVVWFPK